MSSIVTLDTFGRTLREGIALSRSTASGRWGHRHAHEFHLLILLKSVTGTVAWEAGSCREARSRTGDGEAIFWPAGVQGTLCVDGALDVVSIGVAPTSLARWGEEILGDEGFTLAPRFGRDDFLAHLSEAANALGTPATPRERLVADALSKTLAAHVLTAYATPMRGAVPRPGAVTRTVLRRVSELVEAELDGDLAVARLARVAGLSPHHFSRAFRSATGQSPHRFVIARRLERARAMLGAGASIAEAAHASGFSSQSHLTQQFRRAFGMTPGEFVRRLPAR